MQVDKPTNPKDHAATSKLPLWLLSPIAKAHWCAAQYAGLMKYGAWNWRAAGVRASIYLSAMERHLEAWKSGEEIDPTDGTHHMGNIMACAAILLEAQAIDKLTDDRPPAFSHRVALAQAEAAVARLQSQYATLNPRHWTIADTEECNNVKA